MVEDRIEMGTRHNHDHEHTLGLAVLAAEARVRVVVDRHPGVVDQVSSRATTRGPKQEAIEAAAERLPEPDRAEAVAAVGAARAARWTLAHQLGRMIRCTADRWARSHRRDPDDCHAEAQIGAYLAAGRWDPHRGVAFSTYALPWIKARLHHLTDADCDLFVPRNLREDAYKIASARRESRGTATDAEVADRCEITVARVQVVDAATRTAQRLDAPIPNSPHTLADQLAVEEIDLDDAIDTARSAAAVRAALDHVTARERGVIEARYLSADPQSLAVVGREMGVSRERVRQIEVQTLRKLAAAMG